MDAERRIVLDANILMRAVLGKKVREVINEHADAVAFFAPQVAYDDTHRHLPVVFTKRRWSTENLAEAVTVLDELTPIVRVVAEEEFATMRAEALARIEVRDPDDWPILALALALNCPVWTEDYDFFGAGVPTWTSDRVKLYLDPTRPQPPHRRPW